MYTPTTEDVAYWYEGEFDPFYRRAEFDRWLYSIKAEAWDACVVYAPLTAFERERLKKDNPYKEGE